VTTIMLTDDHRIVRDGLKVLLNAEADFEVIGEAADGVSALELIEKLRPDILVIDLNLPGLTGLEVLEVTKVKYPQIKTIVLSMHSSEDYVRPAFANGASGYILKDACVDDLVYAIRQALAGSRYLSPQLAERAIDAYLHAGQSTADDQFNSLSQRERQVLQLAAEGFSYAEIGDQLMISPRTVETHRNNVMRKLGLNSVPDLVRYAIRRGLISMNT
jgi:DNA-binding NarL/FixJ family response regulator